MNKTPRELKEIDAKLFKAFAESLYDAGYRKVKPRQKPNALAKSGGNFETMAQRVASRWITSFCAVVCTTPDLHNQTTVLIPNQ